MLTAKYGNWALVTGASSGIGEEFTRQLAAAGFNLVLLARRENRLHDLASELKQAHGIQTRIAVIDLTDPNFMDSLCPQIEDLEISLLVNNAGRGSFSAFLDEGIDSHQ